MTEIKGACPAHQGSTRGSDSYSFSTTKKQGHCMSCGLSTWLDDEGRLWGRHSRSQKPFLIDDGGQVVEHEGLPSEPLESLANKQGKSEGMTNDVGSFIPMRGITKDTLEHWNVKQYGDKQVYVYPSGGTKTRNTTHKAFFAGDGFKGDELFGMNLFPAGCSKKIVITEGEVDAMSAWQMLKSSYINPVVSLPGANPSAKLWEKCRNYLDSFEEIVLSVDYDEPGDKLAQRVAEIFPNKVYRMPHFGYKDANEVLVAGKEKEYKQAWWKPKKVKPENILTDIEDFLKLYEDSPDFEYFTTGIEQLDKMMLGICKGYVTLIQAESGLGKTEFTRYLEWRCLSTSEYKIAAMHLEETKLRSVLGLVSYHLNDNLTIKKFIDEKGKQEEVKEAISKITESERFILFDYDMQEGHQELVRQVKYLVAALGVDYVVIEPIQDVVTGTASEKESKLSDLITQLSTLAAQMNVGIVVVAHQNNDGGAMYSSMITKRAAFELLLTRDRDSDDPVEKNRTHVVIGRKNRTGLGTGYAGAVDFSLESYTLKPVEGPKEPKVSRDDF